MWRSRHAAPGAALRALLLLAAATLSACATVRPAAAPGGLEYTGRFSVSWLDPELANPQQRASGRFALRVEGERSELEISTPLGQTLALARVSPQIATLETSDGNRWQSEYPDTLTEQAFGWPAPLAQLPRWLAKRDAADFEEAGWLILIEARQDGLPARLTLRWPAQPAARRVRAVELRLLVDAPPPGKH